MLDDVWGLDHPPSPSVGISDDLMEASPLRQWLADQAVDFDVTSYETSAVTNDAIRDFIPLVDQDDFETWISQPNKAKATDFGPQFGAEAAPSDDEAWPLPPVDSTGRRLMSDAQIQEVLDDYNRTTAALPTGSGGGGGGTAAVVGLPPLSDLACADLAFLEDEREDKISASRNFAITGLNVTGDYFQGERVYDVIYDAFARLDAAGRFNDGDPVGNVWAVFTEVRDPNSLLGLSLRTIGLGVVAEFAILTAVQGAYLAKKELDLINAEQARRNGRCG
jgi:hypothetical protein